MKAIIVPNYPLLCELLLYPTASVTDFIVATAQYDDSVPRRVYHYQLYVRVCGY